MSLDLDIRYRQIVLGQLGSYRRRNAALQEIFMFYCPLCRENKRKDRAGNIYKPEGKDCLWFHCYRCSASLPLREFLLKVAPALGEAYKQESRQLWREATGKATVQQAEEHQPTPYAPIKPLVLKQLPSIESLPDDHPAKSYILNRQIPACHHNWLFWAEDFASVAQTIRPDGTYAYMRPEPRLVIPFFDADFKLMGVQGRDIEPDAAIRYKMAKVHDDAPRVYGLHRKVNPDEPVYVVEGPFDSMFLPNCLAGDVPGSCEQNAVMVYDNERRKKQTVEKMLQAAKHGLRVCVWPEYIMEKDINDMVLAGRTASSIKEIIDENTFHGRSAVTKINRWKRC